MSSEPEPCEEPELSVEGEEIVCETYIIKSEEDDEHDDEEDAKSEIFSMEGHRPVRPVERQKMRPWLIDLLDKNILPGLSWQNKKENIFRISWKHAAHNCFNRNRDSDLFERWAVHTGRHHEGNHKRWKANFRCALNSLPDVMELKELGVRKGDNAFKVYKFLDSADPTMKEKMEIKRKYSLMAGIKLEESQSGSSTPTVSTAPSSPDPENSVGVDGGIQTLLKAIELKTQQQDHSKTPQKRASTGSIIQTRSKRSKKESKDDSENQHPEGTVMYQLPLTISSGRPSPASTPGSDKSSSSTVTLEEAKQMRLPYFGSVDPKTGKLTLVQLKKSDIPSAPSTPIATASTLGATRPEMIVNYQGQGQTLTALSQPGLVIPQVQTGVKPGEQAITVPVSLAEKLKTGSTQEQKVTIPIHLLQQEFLQKSAQSTGLVSLGALLAGNSAASLHVTKQLESFLNPAVPIPLPVLEQINQAKLKEKQKSLSEFQPHMMRLDTQTEMEMPGLMTSPLITENTSLPIPQLNKNFTSIAAALRMSAVTKPACPVAMATTSTIQTTHSTAGISSGGLASDPHGIRSKLVSRLMVSGSSMTSTAPNVRMPAGIQMAAPMSTPRPRLDHLLVKPNPNLTLPRTQLQPVRQSDVVVTAMATSSNIDQMSTTGPPKLMQVSEKYIDLSGKLNTEFTTISATATKTAETDVVSIASSGSAVPSPVCTPELRPDILDRQVTIELGKMEKEILTAKSPEDSQHYLCLWCQINFEKKSDLLHHFLQLHQDMLVVPGESEGQERAELGNQATLQVSSALQEMVSDVSSTTPNTVADVSSTSSDIIIRPLDNISPEEDDDEPPVIIDVMINTNQHRSRQNVFGLSASSQYQRSIQGHEFYQRNIQPPPVEELSNTSTISAAESMDSVSKPKYSLNDLIKALSQSLEQDQVEATPLSVMLSPALQQFNLAQATAIQTDPGLSGIPSTVKTGIATPRGRGRGRGRGSSTGRGRGRRRKEADVSPEMPRLTPEVPKTDICYDNLPESSESGDDEGPPKISRIVNRRAPKSKATTSTKSTSTSYNTAKSPNTTKVPLSTILPALSGIQPLSSEEAFIPGLILPSASSRSSTIKFEKEETEDESSDQAIHVTVKMYEVNGKTMYKCTECGKDFSKTCTFARHAMQHSKMYPYQCGICDMKCGDMRILLRHLDQHAEDADCPCQKCDRMNKEFSEETQRKVSAAFHFKCNLCGKKFFSDYACKMHVNAHKRKMTLTCEQCKLEFRCNRILSRHRKALHDTQFCPVCLETCSNLVAHMRTHVGFTLYRCGLCGDGFNSRPNLHDHLRIHTQLGAEKTPVLTAVASTTSKPDSALLDSQKQQQKADILRDEREAKMATETLIALGNAPEFVPLSEKREEVKSEATGTSGDQSPTDFIVRTGEYEDEDGEIDVHVIPKARRERFKSKSSEISDDKDISVELTVPPQPRRQVSRRCRWHGNDSLCERCDDTFVKKMSSNRKRRSGERGSSRGRRGSKSPRSDVSDSFRLNSDSLDSLKNIEFSLPLANYILKGDDSKQEIFLGGEKSKTEAKGDPTVIELSD